MADSMTAPMTQATPNVGGATTNPPAGNPPAAAPTEPVAPATAVTGADPSAPPVADPAGQAPANEPPKESPKVPEKYDLKLPETSLLDAAYIDKISAVAKQNGLTNEQAQALLSEQDASLSQAVSDRAAKWLEQLKSDSELGPQLSRKVELASRVINRFGSESLKTELNRSGFGNHPELLRFVSRVGEAMAEDTLINPGTPPKARPSTAEVFYGPAKTT